MLLLCIIGGVFPTEVFVFSSKPSLDTRKVYIVDNGVSKDLKLTDQHLPCCQGRNVTYFYAHNVTVAGIVLYYYICLDNGFAIKPNY